MDDPRSSGGASGDRVSVLLMKSWSDGEATIIRQLLATYGIPCQVVSDVSHAVLPLSVDGLGEIRIRVPAARLAEARSLIAEHRREGFRVLEGGRARERACQKRVRRRGRG